MKTLTSFLTVLFLLMLSACNDKVEESFNDVETDMNILIPVSSASDFSVTKSAIEIPFSGTNAFYVASIIHQEINIFNIYDIKPRNGSFIRFSGIPEDHGVNCLVFNWNYTSSINPANNMDESFDLLSMDYTINNGEFEINLDNKLAQLINSIDDQNGIITVMVSGSCCNNMCCIATLHVPITVTTQIYSPHFELTF